MTDREEVDAFFDKYIITVMSKESFLWFLPVHKRLPGKGNTFHTSSENLITIKSATTFKNTKEDKE